MSGLKPATREQLGAVFKKGYFYIFGGAAQQSYNDLRKLDIGSYEWKLLYDQTFSYQIKFGPDARFAHTLDVYRNFLVVFGGAGLYQHEIKKRETFDDLRIFDLDQP